MATSSVKSLDLNEAEQLIYARLEHSYEQERERVAKLLTDKDDPNLLGQTELGLRERVHALGAKVLKTVADERQKWRLRKS